MGNPQKDNFHNHILSIDKIFPFGYLRRQTQKYDSPDKAKPSLFII